MLTSGTEAHVADERAAPCAAHPAGGSRERTRRRRPVHAPQPADHPDRPGRHREDAAGAGRRENGRDILSRRSLLGRAGPDRRPSHRRPGGRHPARRARYPRARPDRGDSQARSRPSGTGGTRQLRAPRGGRGQTGGVPARRLPCPGHVGHQPGGPRRGGRAELAGATAVAARGRVRADRIGAGQLRRGQAVRAAGAASAAVIQGHRRQRRGGADHLPAARRPAAGHRAGGRENADTLLDPAGRADGRHLHRPGRRRALRATSSSGPARDPGLELRPARHR